MGVDRIPKIHIYSQVHDENRNVKRTTHRGSGQPEKILYLFFSYVNES